MKTLHELAEYGECMWIVSDEDVKPALYCSDPTLDKYERYCAVHRKMGTKPLQPRARPYFKKSYRQ